MEGDKWSAIRNRYTDSEYQQLKDDLNSKNINPQGSKWDPIYLFSQWENNQAHRIASRIYRLSAFFLCPLEDMPLYINYTDDFCLGSEITNYAWSVRCIAKWRLRIGK